MAKVYLCAVLLAAAGVGLAAADRKLRVIPSVESKGTPAEAVKPADGAKPTGPSTPTPTQPKTDGATPTNGTPQVETPNSPATHTPQATPPAKGDEPAPAPGKLVPIDGLDVATLPAKLTLQQAYTLFSKGSAFIDGRKPEEYAASHVENATNLRNDDVQQNTQTWKDFFEVADLSATHVVYCYGADCHEADQLRETMMAVGFKKVFVMAASVEEWKAAGGPTN